MPRQVDEARVAERKTAIINAAADLFATNGYDYTTVAQIGEAIGFTPAAIFYYFGDKPAIFRAMFEADLPRNEALINRYAETTHPLQAIVDIVTALGEEAAHPNASGILVELLRRIGHDPELVDIVSRSAAIIQSGLERLIAEGIEMEQIDPELDPATSASWLQSIVDAAYLNATPGHSPRIELERTARAYLAAPMASPAVQ